ncbi:MAG: hypothetical protein ACHBN1_18295 [Heteroscytonema crispum UTEX LB 1556]
MKYEVKTSIMLFGTWNNNATKESSFCIFALGAINKLSSGGNMIYCFHPSFFFGQPQSNGN